MSGQVLKGRWDQLVLMSHTPGSVRSLKGTQCHSRTWRAGCPVEFTWSPEKRVFTRIDPVRGSHLVRGKFSTPPIRMDSSPVARLHLPHFLARC